MSASERSASPGFWLQQAALAWRAELADRLKVLDLTPTQYTVLASVARLQRGGRRPTQQAVADEAGADRMMTSKVVRVLERRGLLERDVHETDTRALRLSLTDEGRSAARRGGRIAGQVDAELFGGDAGDLGERLRGLAERRAGRLRPGSRPL